MITKQDLERFWKRIKIDQNNCWVWIGASTKYQYKTRTSHYGACTFKGKNMRVHRIFFEAYKGKLKKGLEIDHLCRNTLCVNPEHLEAVSHSENVKRGTSWQHLVEKAKLITHCPRGHEYNEANTDIFNNQRHCKICRRDRVREFERMQRRKMGIKTWAERYPNATALKLARGE